MSSSEWVTEAAVETATRCLRHFYPTGTLELAQKALTAAAPHMEGLKRGTARKAVIFPDPAVEAVARIIYDRDSTGSWDSIDNRLQKIYKDDARVMLDAVSLKLQ